jgi:HNH endonuclease/NUMOD3 motif
MSITNKCQNCNKQTKNKYCSLICYYEARKKGKYPPYWLGKKRSNETKEKIRQTNKGKLPWNTGKKLSLEHKKKMSKAKIGKYIGEKHPNWKGGKRQDERGYIRIWISKRKWKYEHILVMEKHLKRTLQSNEVVHHINQDKSDNRLENLMLFPNNTAHLRYHREILLMPIKNQYSQT